MANGQIQMKLGQQEVQAEVTVRLRTVIKKQKPKRKKPSSRLG